MPTAQPTAPSPPLPPGTSRLGGAAAGLSYEGVLWDALAQDERAAPKPPRKRLQ